MNQTHQNKSNPRKLTDTSSIILRKLKHDSTILIIPLEQFFETHTLTKAEAVTLYAQWINPNLSEFSFIHLDLIGVSEVKDEFLKVLFTAFVMNPANKPLVSVKWQNVDLKISARIMSWHRWAEYQTDLTAETPQDEFEVSAA